MTVRVLGVALAGAVFASLPGCIDTDASARNEYLTILLAETRTDEDSLELVVEAAELERRGLEDWVNWLDSRRGSGSVFLMTALGNAIDPVGFHARRRAFDDLTRFDSWTLLSSEPALRSSLEDYQRAAVEFDAYGGEAVRSMELALDTELPRGDWVQMFVGQEETPSYNSDEAVLTLRASGFMPRARDLYRMLLRRESMARDLLAKNRALQLLLLEARGDPVTRDTDVHVPDSISHDG